MGAMMTRDRMPFFMATDRIMPLESYLYCRAGDTVAYTGLHDFKDLGDLKVYSIGVLSGSAADENLTAAGLDVQRVGSYEQNLNKLILGRVDLMEGDKFAMYELVNKKPEYKGTVRRLHTPVAASPLYNIISRANPDHAVIVSDFNRGLREMIEDGTFDAVVEEYGFGKLR